jgi:hypothetical protein
MTSKQPLIAGRLIKSSETGFVVPIWTTLGNCSSRKPCFDFASLAVWKSHTTRAFLWRARLRTLPIICAINTVYLRSRSVNEGRPPVRVTQPPGRDECTVFGRQLYRRFFSRNMHLDGPPKLLANPTFATRRNFRQFFGFCEPGSRINKGRWFRKCL